MRLLKAILLREHVKCSRIRPTNNGEGDPELRSDLINHQPSNQPTGIASFAWYTLHGFPAVVDSDYMGTRSFQLSPRVQFAVNELIIHKKNYFVMVKVKTVTSVVRA